LVRSWSRRADCFVNADLVDPQGGFVKKILSVSGALLLLMSALSTAAVAQPSPSANWHAERVCPDVPAGNAACFALKYVDDSTGSANALPRGGQVTPASSTPPSTGKTPADIQSAYNIAGLKSGGRTVAIVDAYGYPNLERDLGVYRSQFGLPACTVSNGCLTIMNQNGGSRLPRFNSGWADETALDVDAVSAACPDCKILVVQATTASITNLGTAVATAAKQPGVVAISNSYGGGDSSDSSYGVYYNQPGIAVTSSTGDNGYSGSSYPASSSYVTAVGGTSLVKDSSARGWGESAWSGSGSGCSTVNAALPAAAAFGTGCGKRASADVAAVADPQTGLSVYAPSSSTTSSWAQYGGTSLSSPLIAAVYALSGNSGGATAPANSLPYTNAGKFNDVASGSTGSCLTSQWCLAGTGWDGPTGVGTPNGAAGL
jgi:subtilase family serine protease